MSKPITYSVLALLIAGIVFWIFLQKGKNAEKVEPLKLGWQPPWINQGQLVVVLKHSDILKKNKVKVGFNPFTYGGPMTEAALAGSLDIIFAGDQPVITLLSKDSSWRIVARMVNYRSAIIIPRNSTFQSIQDLKGKRIAAAFGSTTHRDLIREFRKAGIDPKKDLELVNIDQAEHASLIEGGTDTWHGVDAIATYDPTIAKGIYKGNAKVLLHWISPSLVAVKDKVIREREDDLAAFLQSYQEAFVAYANNPARYNQLYSAESRLNLPDSVYAGMASIEPNMLALDIVGVHIDNDPERQGVLQANADLAFEMGLIKRKINIQSFLHSALTIKTAGK